MLAKRGLFARQMASEELSAEAKKIKDLLLEFNRNERKLLRDYPGVTLSGAIDYTAQLVKDSFSAAFAFSSGGLYDKGILHQMGYEVDLGVPKWGTDPATIFVLLGVSLVNILVSTYLRATYTDPRDLHIEYLQQQKATVIRHREFLEVCKSRLQTALLNKRKNIQVKVLCIRLPKGLKQKLEVNDFLDDEMDPETLVSIRDFCRNMTRRLNPGERLEAGLSLSLLEEYALTINETETFKDEYSGHEAFSVYYYSFMQACRDFGFPLLVLYAYSHLVALVTSMAIIETCLGIAGIFGVYGLYGEFLNQSEIVSNFNALISDSKVEYTKTNALAHDVYQLLNALNQLENLQGEADSQLGIDESIIEILTKIQQVLPTKSDYIDTVVKEFSDHHDAGSVGLQV